MLHAYNENTQDSSIQRYHKMTDDFCPLSDYLAETLYSLPKEKKKKSEIELKI